MKIAINVFRGLVGVTGAIQLILGVVFWTGHAKVLLPLHMSVGLVFVLALWTLAVLSALAGAPIGPAVAAVVGGLLIPVFGMTQMRMLPGSAHWVVQVVHLLMGMAGMGLAARLQAGARAAAGGRGGARSGSLVVVHSPTRKP